MTKTFFKWKSPETFVSKENEESGSDRRHKSATWVSVFGARLCDVGPVPWWAWDPKHMRKCPTRLLSWGKPKTTLEIKEKEAFCSRNSCFYLVLILFYCQWLWMSQLLGMGVFQPCFCIVCQFLYRTLHFSIAHRTSSGFNAKHTWPLFSCGHILSSHHQFHTQLYDDVTVFWGCDVTAFFSRQYLAYPNVWVSTCVNLWAFSNNTSDVISARLTLLSSFSLIGFFFGEQETQQPFCADSPLQNKNVLCSTVGRTFILVNFFCHFFFFFFFVILIINYQCVTIDI